MRYRKATEVLPEELVEAIQKYMDGGYVYIPRKEENKKKWGEETSFRGEPVSYTHLTLPTILLV